MAVVALASRALAARDLAAAARRGRRLARRARWAAHGPRAPRGDARRRARRGVHRRPGRRPPRPVTHPHPSDDPPRGGHRPLARRPHGRGYTGAGPALRHGRGVVRARGPSGPRRRRGVRRGRGRRRMRARRRRRRGQCAGRRALPLYRGAERRLGRYAGGGSGGGGGPDRRRAGLGAAARRVAVCGAGPRRSGGMAPRNMLGGRWRRRHRAAVVTAGDVNTPVLLVRGVTRRRRGAAAPVADASLELAAGEVVALVGPPGSGKTTLLAITAGRLAPDAGSVLVAGVARGTLAARALLGYAPAAPVFPPTLRVREVLEYFARFHVVGVARRGKYSDRKSTRLNSSHQNISYGVFCLKKKKHSRKGAPAVGNRFPHMLRPDGRS